MRRLLLSLTFIPLIFSFLAAQRGPSQNGQTSKVKLVGSILNSADDTPLEFATVTLFSESDSSMVTGGITDLSGKYEMEARAGSYYAVVEFLSFKSKTIPNIQLAKGEPFKKLEPIKLLSDAAILNEVQVTAEKSTMQLSLDKRVFNVGKDLSNQGGTAVDILDNVPSVTVDVEGNVSLRGSQGVRILVDGRPSGLVGVGGSGGLRNLSANMIEKVEVITNPSARYEASGMAGIINIVLKKDRKKGLNGSFDLSGGLPSNYGAAINLNYRRNNLNWFMNYGLRYRRGPGISNRYTEFYRGGDTYITDQTGTRSRGGWSNSFRFGADYFFTPKTTLTTAFLYRRGDDDNTSLNKYFSYFNDLNNLTSIRERSDNEIEDESNLEYSLRFKHDFKEKGHTLSADIRYQDNIEEEGSDYVNRYFLSDGSPSAEADETQRSFNQEGERRIVFQVDYEKPIGGEGKFELGYRAGLRQISNDYIVEDFNDIGWVPIAELTNEFLYDENIHALYSMYGNKVNQWSYQVGLRAEYTDVVTELLNTNEINPRDYFNLFPSAFLNYEFSAGSSIQASYSRRINRPRFRSLNPFFTFSDDRNFYSGNPDLNPEFTDSYEIGYIKIWDKASLTSSIFYRHTTDVVERISRANANETTTTRPENLLTEDNIGFEFTFSVEPVKKWTIDGNVNIFRSIVDGGNLGPDFQADTYTSFGRLTSKVTLFKDIDAQLRFNYRAPRTTTQGKSRAYQYFDLAVAKDILKKKATLTLSVRDLFNSRLYRFTNFGDSFFMDGEMRWRPRTATLTFNYRLNQKKRRGRGGRGGEGGGDYGGEF